MRQLSMSWNTERGHLVCRWIELKETEQCERFSASGRLRPSCDPGSQLMAIHMPEWPNGFRTGFAVVRHIHRRAYRSDASGER
jgi:hypothetical protein